MTWWWVPWVYLLLSVHPRWGARETCNQEIPTGRTKKLKKSPLSSQKTGKGWPRGTKNIFIIPVLSSQTPKENLAKHQKWKHVYRVCMSAKLLQSCTTQWDPMDCSLPGCQAPLSMGFSWEEYWSELPCPPPGDLLDPRVELASLTSPALSSGFFTTNATWGTYL